MNLISIRSFRRLLHLLLINEPTVVNDGKTYHKSLLQAQGPTKMMRSDWSDPGAH